MDHILTIKEFKRMTDEYEKVKYICKCGHRVVIPKWVDKQLCDCAVDMYLKIKGQNLSIE